MGYTLYINFENFTFKVGECIGTAKRNLWHCWDSKEPKTIKISFNIYCVRSVDQAFYESLYLFILIFTLPD